MKARMTAGLWFLFVLCCAVSAFAQNRLDIALEGPWIFYKEPKFTTTAGTSTVLIAIAPKVKGHYPLVFGTGNGFLVDPGVYCVGFGNNCTPNALTNLAWDGYVDPSPVQVSKPAGWDWTTLGSVAYVLILPMPDSYSADGQYSMSFQSAFPKPGVPGPTTASGSHAIGVQLHYATGPNMLYLLTCLGVPSVATCNTSTSTTPQTNSGTLRISVKTVENYANSDICDHHVHRAYHKMLHLVDDSLASNKQIAYIDVPAYDDNCSPCDPQQDQVSSECSGMDMPTVPAVQDVAKALDTLVAFLKENLQQHSTEVRLPELAKQADALTGKFPTQSQLLELKKALEASEKGIEDLLQTTTDSAVALSHDDAGFRGLRLNLQVAASQERGLVHADDDLTIFAHSGKDCRAPTMQVQ